MKVCIVGLGEVGLPTAKYVLSRGFKVYGHDRERGAVKRAQVHGIRGSTEWSRIPPSDVYILCVPTKTDTSGRPDLSAVRDASRKLFPRTRRNTLVSIESTLVPGTCREIYRSILGRRPMLVHVPHRYWREDPERRGVNQLRVIGGMTKRSMKRGIRFYQEQLGIPLYKVPSIEVAEMSKIAENAYRYVQIGMAEQLKMICHQIGLDFEEVRRACNTKWNVEILEAREGIGGKCLPKDTRHLASLSRHNALLETVMDVDKQYRRLLGKHTNSIGASSGYSRRQLRLQAPANRKWK
jgi:nucleotide sugar dehydrogenase